MLGKKYEISYFDYSLFIATILSLITFLNTFVTPVLNGRLLYFLFYYTFLNFTILLFLAFIVNSKPRIFKHPVKKWAFLVITIFYSIFYLGSSFSFFRTGQTIKIQSIYFTYQINPFLTILMLFLGLILIISMAIILLSKKIKFKRVKVLNVLWSKIIFIVCLIFLLSFIFYVSPRFNIENSLVKFYTSGHEILVHPEVVGNENLFSIKTNMSKPNVVFILLESISDEKISYYGYERETTPNIDNLAKKGIVFMNAYTTATHSDYAQPTYLSSRYVLENNHRTFYNVNLNRTFVWDIFAKEGYTTGYISSQDDSWANMDGYLDTTSVDFYWYSLTDGKTDYGTGLAKKDYDHKTMDVVLNWLNDSFVECSSYENETINETIIFNYDNCSNYEFAKNEPFFLYINLQGTHNPLTYHENYSIYKPDSPGPFNKDNYDNRYDNSLSYVDAQLGRLLEYLEQENVLNDTVFVLTSDHGHDTKNRHNINGHAKSVYDEELRVPLVIYFPDLPHLEIEERVSHIDVLPTFLEFFGLENPGNFEGKPMVKDNRLIFYIQNHKYLVGMIKNNIKIIVDLNRNIVEVYDLEKDPKELVNLFRFGNYDSEILEILLWHNCQLNYFSVEDKPANLKNYCEAF